jgi:fatty-acyl-CoA synthase
VAQKNPPGLDQTPRGTALQAWVRALENARIVRDRGHATLVSLLDELADAHGDRPALLGEDEQFGYRDLIGRSNRYSRWTMVLGLAKGDVVCLLMPNRPDYFAFWLGVTRTGCAVALINTNLIGDALLHSIQAAGAAHLVVDNTLLPAVMTVVGRLPPGLRVWVLDEPAPGPWSRIEPEITALSAERVNGAEGRLPAPTDRALLIYTSGTTGLPKAAHVTHARVLEWSLWFAGMMNVQPVDRLFNCLPMYHSTGGIVAIGAMLVKGGSVVIRPRFSANRFWDDVTDFECTIFQYIGELCRYLTLSPPHPKERQHQLRLACGNGLRGDVWKDFRCRFGIAQILEFYAATEGIVSLYNCEGKPGAVGRIPSFLAHHFPVTLIRSDPGTATVQRDAAGFCIPCAVDEAGEAIGQLPSATDFPARRFDGYTDRVASAQKVLRDVFAKGDRWFRTGDLLRKDSAGFFYFVDRIGDTFRWRGENVSTTEVAAVLRAFQGVTDAIVYGVTVPENEGRAGMTAITTDDRFELAGLSAHLAAHLPAYAHPLFVRLCHSLEVTGTFKLIKGKFMREGYAEATDPVWFNDRCTGRFIACSAELARAIGDGRRRL